MKLREGSGVDLNSPNSPWQPSNSACNSVGVGFRLPVFSLCSFLACLLTYCPMQSATVYHSVPLLKSKDSLEREETLHGDDV